MKKLFTVGVCVLLVAGSQVFAGPRGAKVHPVPPPEADGAKSGELNSVLPGIWAIGPGDSLGATLSDYATNGSACHNLINYGDGTLALGRMMALTDDATDRGTHYSYSSDGGTTWSPLSWVEGARRGWGNIDQLPMAGGTEVTAAHDFAASLALDLCVDAAKGSNVWSCQHATGASQVWPRLAVTDPFTLHTVYANANPATDNLYGRSVDAGASWDIIDQTVFTIPGFVASADGQDIASYGSTVAIVNATAATGTSQVDLLLALSTDDGNTWTQSVIYDQKGPGELPNGEEQYQTDGTVACTFDNNGNLHVVWCNFLAIGDASSNPVLFYQIDAPILHWSEATGVTEIMPTVHDTSITITTAQFGNLNTQPDIAVDANNNLYVMYQQYTAEQDTAGNYLQHIFAAGSNDGGATWAEPKDITPGEGFEASFGSMADLADDYIHLTYFSDPLGGSFIRGNHPLIPVAVMYHNWPTSDLVPGTSDIFWDDFDAYTAGMQLAAQNGVDWTTWSAMPGSGEDPFVSDDFSFSGNNSVVIEQNNDLVRLHDQRSSGTWSMSFQMYIPAGHAGYFNTLSDFNQPSGPYYWAMETYFDAGGGGRLLTGDPQMNFAWTEDTWHSVKVIADLDDDIGQFVFDGDLIHEWTWTNGASAGTGPLELDANDFFGATAGDEMYMDDYHFEADTLFVVSVGNPGTGIPQQYDLSQNFPNPFNPSTRITYALPEQASVTLKIYNVLGQEVVTLADRVQEAGYHEAVWNAQNAFGQTVGTGVYFYRLEATGTSGEQFINFKKMLFLK